jgi:hypothetical protein
MTAIALLLAAALAIAFFAATGRLYDSRDGNDWKPTGNPEGRDTEEVSSTPRPVEFDIVA